MTAAAIPLLPDMIAAQDRAAPAIEFEGETISFGQLAEDAARIAGILTRDYCVKEGDRVAWLGLNHPNILRLLLACHRLGAIFNPLNSRLAREEYRYLLGDSGPNVCFFDQHFAAMAASLSDAGRLAPAEALTADAPPAPVADTGEAAALLLVYTSGTTGRPKGVLLSRRAVAANIENSQEFYALGPGQTIMMNLPLFHVGGLCILLLPALAHGAKVILHARFDPAETLATLQRGEVVGAVLVPAQMNVMIGGPGWAEADFANLRYLIVGSSVIPLAHIQAWHAKGVPVSQVYGATETGPGAIALALDEAMANEGAAGRRMKHCQIRIVRPDGSECDVGEAGEVLVKGPNVMTGYWRNPEQTATVLVGGWYHTGDVGEVDETGLYRIVDRIKDVVISGGENIYPAEVEMISSQHPAIAAIAVIGRADPRWGETPVAVVELAEGASLTLPEYHEFLADRLARFKQPKDLIVTPELPRNSLGKVDKNRLRAEYG